MSTETITAEETSDIARQDDAAFTVQIESLLKEAEDLRLSYMRKHRTRGHITMTIGLISLTIGASGFGWFLLMEAEILRAVGSMALAIIIPILLNIWASGTIREYKKAYKIQFMPRMAKAIGGFKFHPARGISRQIISKTGLIPKHDIYNAEDCFMGRYKGVKVLFSEARLLHKKKYLEPIFDGVFVLLETPQEVIEGHTILTADHEMFKKWRPSRWAKLQDVSIKTENPDWNRFQIVSDKPEAASLLIGEKLLKELSEAAEIFDKSPLSAAFFRKKFVFLMIPYKGDLFEASDIHMPVATKQHALECKKEIEKLLEVIDVFELYKPAQTSKPAEEPVQQTD